MTGGKASRQKGDRHERAIVNFWRALGVKCNRVPLSGASARTSGAEYGGDIDLYAFGEEEAPIIGEAKCRGGGFKQLYAWLGTQNEFLIVKQDKAERLYVIPERVMRRFVKP